MRYILCAVVLMLMSAQAFAGVHQFQPHSDKIMGPQALYAGAYVRIPLGGKVDAKPSYGLNMAFQQHLQMESATRVQFKTLSADMVDLRFSGQNIQHFNFAGTNLMTIREKLSADEEPSLLKDSLGIGTGVLLGFGAVIVVAFVCCGDGTY